MTSNLGAEHLLSDFLGKSSMQVAHKQVMQEVRKHFRAELLSRLDEIVVFDPLSRDQLREVARLQMKVFAGQFAERSIALGVTDAALNYILDENCNLVYGATSIRRWLAKKVVTELSILLVGEGVENSTVRIEAGPNRNELIYEVKKDGGLGDVLIQLPNGTGVQ